ncbi:MAG: acetate--CoA ligase family protein, partial [Deltaproteobacteria bacterium]|nr:acetate--CoA ligase family protein [Deltaproteobacteria bacterium]
KGLSETLTHKTEKGLVRLSLSSPGQVEQACGEMDAAVGGLSGYLVQPMVPGSREFVAGLFTDPLFGPVVMFGVGGVATEAFADVCFGLAPLTRDDALRMVQGIRAKKLLGPFRGEAAVDLDQAADVLLGLSRLAQEIPQVGEVDINPLKATTDGRLVAVDALVVPAGEEAAQKAGEFVPVPPARVGAFFHPKSVAFVGASARFGKWGHMLFTNLLAGGFPGQVHLVNPKGGTIVGKKVYASVSELPEGVDLAVVTIPAAGVIQAIRDLAAKGVRHVVLITSGFGETGPEGRALEKELVETARELDVLIMGPNTMGICNPHTSFFCTGSHVRPQPGSTALVAQSGNMGTQLMAFAEKENIGIRAFAGSGNEAMVTIEDFMDGFAVDTKTRTVVLYLESVKQGRRFYESARRVGREKPVVVLKGGRTEAGGRAAASHTGAMAADNRVFDAVCRQAGIIQVTQPMDLLDLSAAFSSLPLPRGNRVAIMSLGGGWGVVTSDLCNEYGLSVPDLSPEILAEIDQILPPYWSRANPVDLVGERDHTLPVKVSELLAAWDGCDAVINLGILGRRHGLLRMVQSAVAADPGADADFLYMLHEHLGEFEQNYARHLIGLMEKYEKPILSVPLITDDTDKTLLHFEGRKYAGVAFKTPERAVKALSRMWEYRDFRDRKGAP